MLYILFSLKIDPSIISLVNNTIPSTNDLSKATKILVLGGDGTLLYILSKLAKPPLIYAINYGSRGILMPFTKNQLPHILLSLQKNLPIIKFTRKRYLMNGSFYFLNETSISKNKANKLNKYKIYINNEFIKEIACDNIIISTPAGSSAYSYSAGGPYVTEDCDVIIITAVAPCGNNVRSMVVSNMNKVRVVGGDVCVMDGVFEERCESVEVVFDGNEVEFAYFESDKTVENIRFNKIFY